MLQDKFSDGRVLSDHTPLLADIILVGATATQAPLEAPVNEGPRAAVEDISPLLRACVEFITKEGLDSEGLFRVPGSKETVDKIIAESEHASLVDLRSLVSVLHRQ